MAGIRRLGGLRVSFDINMGISYINNSAMFRSVRFHPTVDYEEVFHK
jgi:hypothetical protein